MSTLMHLPGHGLTTALGEIARVVRPGGLVSIGLWGHDTDGERTDDHGRYFRQRTHDDLRTRVAALGELVSF